MDELHESMIDQLEQRLRVRIVCRDGYFDAVVYGGETLHWRLSRFGGEFRPIDAGLLRQIEAGITCLTYVKDRADLYLDDCDGTEKLYLFDGTCAAFMAQHWNTTAENEESERERQWRKEYARQNPRRHPMTIRAR